MSFLNFLVDEFSTASCVQGVEELRGGNTTLSLEEDCTCTFFVVEVFAVLESCMISSKVAHFCFFVGIVD